MFIFYEGKIIVGNFYFVLFFLDKPFSSDSISEIRNRCETEDQSGSETSHFLTPQRLVKMFFYR